MVTENKRQEEKEAKGYAVTPSDGGWGWVVCFASVVCNFVLDGIAYGFGVFLTEFSDYYSSSKAKTSLVGSLLCGVYMLTGPIAGALVNRFGCRPVTVAGAFISGIAFFISTFSNTIDGLIVLYGILGGFGIGLIFIPAVVAVGYYFEKKRALATGLAVAGSGLGTMAVPPLCRFILENNDWKYTVSIMGCLLMNCAVLGMLMRPLEAKPVKTKPRRKSLVDRIRGRNRKESIPLDQQEAADKLEEAKQSRLKRLEDAESDTSSTHNSAQFHNSHRPRAHTFSAPTTPTADIISDLPVVDETRELQSPGGMYDAGHDMRERSRRYSETTNMKDRYGDDDEEVKSDIHTSMSDILRQKAREIFKPQNQEIQIEDYGRPMYRKDIFYTGSVANFHAFKSQPDVTNYIQSITSIPQNLPGEHQSSCPIWMCPCLSKSARDTMATMMDFSLLKNPSFLVIILANVFGTFALFIPFVFLADRAMLLGVGPVEAAFLVSIIGIANTVGRVLWGVLADIPKIKAIWVNNITLLATAITVILSPFCDNYATMVVFAVFFGLFVAGFVSLTSVLICDICGLENLTTGFGLVTLFRGITSMIGPPVAGTLYDSIGSYDIPFFMAGGCFFVCTLTYSLLLLPIFTKPQTQSQETEDQELRDKLNRVEDGEDSSDSN